ncbi:MAG: 3-deoxy-manno-octulosonate cytidylyltransferase [Betaproteobacteria bacterium]|nr:MAG: 3-deoxy-manno-octulosonate cytidylyltransferase [Betaproteobacteria bacterium]
MTSFVVVIPARYASTRFPGKPLAELDGKPMVAHVVDRARESGADEVIVATDDKRIASAVSASGCAVAMTRADHSTGTDRIAEVVKQRGWNDGTIVVNAQGDEPLMPPEMISAVASKLAESPDAAIATACHPISEVAEFMDTNAVKVVFDQSGYALYFSRAPIPWPRDAFAAGKSKLPPEFPAYRHVGIYAYRCSFLRTYAELAPAVLERFESLEQLRALANGYRIAVSVAAQAPPPGIDTPEDLERAREQIAKI